MLLKDIILDKNISAVFFFFACYFKVIIIFYVAFTAFWLFLQSKQRCFLMVFKVFFFSWMANV